MTGQEKQTLYEKQIKEKLGSWLTFWCPSAPKSNGLCIFRDTLENCGAWNKFITNFHQTPKRLGYLQVFEYILKTKDVKNLIEWAFDWNRTEETSKFWEQVALQVHKNLKEEEQRGIVLTDLYDDKISHRVIPTVSTPNTTPNEKTSLVPVTPKTNQQPYITKQISIYELLSGATSMGNLLTIMNSTLHGGFDDEIQLDVPITSTTIVKTTLVETT